MGTQLQLLLVVLLLVQMCVMNYKALAQQFSAQQISEIYTNQKERSEIYTNETAMTKPGCPFRCSGGNNVTIPYPFGIGGKCALDETFVITCNTSFHPPRPFIKSIGIQALSISLKDEMVRLEKPLVSKTYSGNFLDWTISGNCSLVDKYRRIYTSNSCSLHSRCIPYWSDTQFFCDCNRGYEGNPYLPDGCQDIDECKIPEIKKLCSKGCVNIPGSFICKKLSKKAKIAMIGVGSGVGTIILLLGLWRVYKEIKRRNKIKLKKKFFKRNGGFLLQKQLSSGEEGNVEKSKLFTLKDLEKATNRYNKNRIHAQGGHGTVYKEMLADGIIVAIKVSAIVDEDNIEQFINEVIILSQISHRNVVKLHGCCLEIEVPLLVYEFIPNGTLFQYIHEKREEFPLSWDVCLRIANEVASALSYLHSAASLPISHQDIKSTNILLDEKYKAKVVNFGTSRSIAINQTHLTTLVLGTFGYLDPEYFQSSQFTEKSDFYSFEVVFIELLTSQKPISSIKSMEMRSLTTYFMVASKEKRLFDILDAQVREEGGKEEITRGANLAKRCLNLSGRKRPTIRKVMVELEGIRIPNGASAINELDEEGEYDIIEVIVPSKTSLTSRACSDVHPFLIE